MEEEEEGEEEEEEKVENCSGRGSLAFSIFPPFLAKGVGGGKALTG